MTPRIQLAGAAKRFTTRRGTTTAVANLDLAIHPGEFVVLLGPSGCGKTTTLRMIAGLESPSEGRVLIDDRDVTSLRPGQRDIAFVFQLFALYPHLTAEENIAFPLRAAGLPRDQVRQRTDRVIARLGLEPLRRHRPRHLSGGDQQRISLARAMVRDPKAFLMDEPLGTLDADQRERTRIELRAIHNELGATTVFVTHDQLEAMSLADRIAVMKDGHLLQFAPPREIYDHPADLFTAHFIGSPGMNFLSATRTESGRYRIANTIAPHEYAVVAPGGPATLTLGIRPEYIHLTSPTDPAALLAQVDHTELLGPYNLLTLTLAASPTPAPGDTPALSPPITTPASTSLTLKARIPANVRLAEGEPTHIRLDPAGLRWFDPTIGKRLTDSPTR